MYEKLDFSPSFCEGEFNSMFVLVKIIEVLYSSGLSLWMIQSFSEPKLDCIHQLWVLQESLFETFTTYIFFLNFTFPTDPFTILELQDPSHDAPELLILRFWNWERDRPFALCKVWIAFSFHIFHFLISVSISEKWDSVYELVGNLYECISTNILRESK